jgi:hypothetical protein
MLTAEQRKEHKKISDKKYYTKHREHRMTKMKEYNTNLSDAQKIQKKISSLNYHRTHKQQEKEYKQNYYAKETNEQREHRIKKDVERNRKNRLKNPQPIRNYNNNRHRKLRLKALQYYSDGSMKCAYCGNSDMRTLTIDHINDNGNAQRKTVCNMMAWLVTNKYPSGFQVLCMNCQFKKKNGSVSIKEPNKINEYNREYGKRTKIKVLSHYSNGRLKCANCEENDQQVLTIDHINGNGNIHRKQTNTHAGIEFYRWLINNNFPEGFQVLCMNHQFIKAREKGEMSAHHTPYNK